jgi:DNA-binding transcriptional ArsR family regulator
MSQPALSKHLKVLERAGVAAEQAQQKKTKKKR